MRLLTLVLVGALAGCAAQSPPPPSPAMVTYINYVTASKPQAEAGTLKWSEYYGRLYALSMPAGMPASHLQRMSNMMLRSAQLERGEISQDQFAAYRREVQIAGQAEFQEIQARQQAQAEERRRQGMEALANIRLYQPQPAYIPPIGGGQGSTFAVTAFFTGRQNQVTTVTNQFGWSCEYNYAGKTFWRTFTGTCPPSVQAQ